MNVSEGEDGGWGYDGESERKDGGDREGDLS